MMPLEIYLQTLWGFVQAARHGTGLNVPGNEETQVFYLRLRTNGTWEVMATHPELSTFSSKTDMIIPLVMPLTPIILIAHVETQWEFHQFRANMVLVQS